MSRMKILIFAGTTAILLGVLLLAWVNDSSRAHYVAETLGLLLIVSGILVSFAGGIIFCRKGDAGAVLFSGLAISGVSLIVIPGLSVLFHFEPNVHSWTGLLFFLWLPSCAVGPILVLVGAGRRFLQNRKSE